MSINDLNQVFDSAVQDGMSSGSVQVLVDNLDATTLAGTFGTAVDDIPTTEVTLVVPVLDMSGSMTPVTKAVIDGYNTMLQAMRDSKQAESILVSTWVFNNQPQLLYGYTPVSQVPHLTNHDYRPDWMTALYDATLDAFTGLVGYGQQLRDSGIYTKCVVVVFSDGADNRSQHSPFDVKTVSADLLQQEIYVLAFVGFETGEPVDYHQIAGEMGFPSVLTAQSTPSEIRKVFTLVSKSVIRQSQTTVDPDKSKDFFAV